MAREGAEAKARRYLTEGRLLVQAVTDTRIAATVRGDGALYRAGHNPVDRWHCSCPARGRCAHVLALQLVTVRRNPEEKP